MAKSCEMFINEEITQIYDMFSELDKSYDGFGECMQ